MQAFTFMIVHWKPTQTRRHPQGPRHISLLHSV